MSRLNTHPDIDFLPKAPSPAVEWIIRDTPIGYEAAVAWMEHRASQIANGQAGECIWLVEHPALYTAGTSASRDDLVQADRFPVYSTGRGGRRTPVGRA